MPVYLLRLVSIKISRSFSFPISSVIFLSDLFGHFSFRSLRSFFFPISSVIFLSDLLGHLSQIVRYMFSCLFIILLSLRLHRLSSVFTPFRHLPLPLCPSRVYSHCYRM